jgi:hypothetical protein
MSENVGDIRSQPLGPPRPVPGKLYLYIHKYESETRLLLYRGLNLELPVHSRKHKTGKSIFHNVIDKIITMIP